MNTQAVSQCSHSRIQGINYIGSTEHAMLPKVSFRTHSPLTGSSRPLQIISPRLHPPSLPSFMLLLGLPNSVPVQIIPHHPQTSHPTPFQIQVLLTTPPPHIRMILFLPPPGMLRKCKDMSKEEPDVPISLL